MPPPNAEANAPTQPPAAIAFGVNPSPNAHTLANPLCGLPFHTWVNLRAVALWTEIEVSSFC